MEANEQRTERERSQETASGGRLTYRRTRPYANTVTPNLAISHEILHQTHSRVCLLNPATQIISKFRVEVFHAIPLAL